MTSYPPDDNFYFFLFLFLFFFRKKILILAMGQPCHMDKVIKSYILRWQNIIYYIFIYISIDPSWPIYSCMNKKLSRRQSCHTDNVIKSYVLKWQNIIYMTQLSNIFLHELGGSILPIIIWLIETLILIILWEWIQILFCCM
jgi:hypothetical protein